MFSIKQRFAVLVLLAAPFTAQAADIKGTVVGVRGSGDVVVKTDSPHHPALGDRVEFSFEVPELDERVVLGSGTVLEIYKGDVVCTVKADSKLAKGVVAVIKATKLTKKADVDDAPQSDPAERGRPVRSGPVIVDPFERSPVTLPPEPADAVRRVPMNRGPAPLPPEPRIPNGRPGTLPEPDDYPPEPSLPRIPNGRPAPRPEPGEYPSEPSLPRIPNGRPAPRPEPGEYPSEPSLPRIPNGRPAPQPPEPMIVDPFAPRPQAAQPAGAGRQLEGFSDRLVSTYTISADGRFVFVGYVGMSDKDFQEGRETEMRIFNTQTGREEACFDGTKNTIIGSRFSADSSMLRIVDLRGTLRTWDMTNQKEQASLSLLKGGENSRVEHVEFSPAGKHVALVQESSDSGDVVEIFDTKTGKCQATLKKIEGMVTTLKFSPDGKQLFGEDDGFLCVWDTETGEALSRVQIPHEDINTVAFSPTGRYAAVASFDSDDSDIETLRVLDVKTGKTVATLTGHKKPLDILAFQPDGTTLVARSADRLLSWDLASGKLVKEQRVPGSFAGLQFSATGTAAVIQGESDIRLLPAQKR